MDYTPFYNLGIALGLGLLVGLQREHSESKMAGIRTFPLITLAGGITAYLAQYWESGWIVAAGALGIVLLGVGSNINRAQNDKLEEEVGGQTTEVAALLRRMWTPSRYPFPTRSKTADSKRPRAGN